MFSKILKKRKFDEIKVEVFMIKVLDLIAIILSCSREKKTFNLIINLMSFLFFLLIIQHCETKCFFGKYIITYFYLSTKAFSINTLLFFKRSSSGAMSIALIIFSNDKSYFPKLKYEIDNKS